MLGPLRTYLRRLNAQSQTVWLKHGRPAFQANTYLQFCNEVVFPFFDCLDLVFRHSFTRRLAKTLGWTLGIGMVGAGLWTAVIVQDKLQQVKQMDKALVHQSSEALAEVLKRFVFQNDFISRMLADIIMKQVLANERIIFMLARSLGRVMVLPSIQNQVNYLVKGPVLHESVLYNPELQQMMARLLVDVLQNPTVQELAGQQLVAFSRSETAEQLLRNGMADGLRLPIVRKLFTSGIVDDTIYPKLTDKALARQLDRQLTDFLQN